MNDFFSRLMSLDVLGTQIQNLPWVILTVIVAWLTITLLTQMLTGVAQILPSPMRTRVHRWVPTLRLMIQVVAVVVIIILVTENAIAAIVSLSLAIGFALRDYVSALIAGIVAVWERPFRQGDWISYGGHYGKVQEIGLRAVRMVTPDDTVIVVPHSVLWNEVVANANDGQPDHLCVADFYLHPNHDARDVRQKLSDVAITSPYIKLDRGAKVIVLEKPWGTHYRVKAYPVSGDDEFLFISDLTVRGKEALLGMKCQFALAPVVSPN